MSSWRPLYHYAPQANWLSDPNGLVWHGGHWHLFYQYNPFGDEWGHMSWGHAISDDLFQWREMPVAIRENERHMIFSGSAVTRPDGRMIAAYTGATRSEPGHQAQYLVTSNDGGVSFTVAGAPAIDEARSDFRDPKLFWHGQSNQWIMLSVRADGGCAVIYGSRDLESWTYFSQIGPFDVPGEVWECPELMELPVTDGGRKWMFKVDLLHVDPDHKGSGAIALAGHFDGREFIPDKDACEKPIWQWVDHGRDFYAAVGWNGGPPGDDGRYWIGWMGNHRYQATLPSTGWRGAMSLPRKLSFQRRQGRLLLAQEPVVPERSGHQMVACNEISLSDDQKIILDENLPRALHIRVALESGEGSLMVEADGGRLMVRFNCIAKTIEFDRSECGFLHEHDDFVRPMLAAWQDTSKPVDLWVDDHCLEIFADDGLTVLTAQSYLAPGALALSILSERNPSVWRQIEVATIEANEEGISNDISVEHD